MVHEPPISLVTGESRWLRITRHGLFATAALALAFSPTDPIWRWAAVAGLGLVAILISINLHRMARIRSLRLMTDGMVTLCPGDPPEIHATLGRDGWFTAWMTIIPLDCLDRPKQLRVLVCRSRNHPDDYRRLLSRMRLGPDSAAKNGIIAPP